MDKAAAQAYPDPLNFTSHHAFIIGIDAYQQVSPLQTAVADAQQIAQVLSTQQHFLVHPPLLDATGDEIRDLLTHTLASVVGKDDRVFFYFAGHGIAADGDDGPAGYIVPADADPSNFDTFIPMDALQEALNNLPCRHLLLVMDCCFSGAFKWSSSHRDIVLTMPKRIYKERFDRFIEDPAWQVITSAAHDQKALDVLNGKTTGERGQVNGQEHGLHSPFAQALFDGLRGEADSRTDTNTEGDGVITATELYAYIRDRVEPESIDQAEYLRQTPGFFPLKKHDKGEFIFLKPNHRLNLPPIPKQSPYKGLVSFDESDRHLFYGRDKAIKALLAKTAENKLVVVTGASGTGKSSVIKAGLLPVMRAQGYQILAVMRPGAHPLTELNKALQALDIPNVEKDDAHPAMGAVLLIDQLEEVITRCENAQERTDFDLRLKELLNDERIYKLIVTVRSDFEPQFSGGTLKIEWQKGRYTVPPFSIEELRDVVLLPTIQEVLIFEPPELVDTIVAEVVQSPGALPLLSYTLDELYDAYRTSGRQDRTLKKDDYEKLGGVMGALRTKADGVYGRLSPPAQQIMRKIMLRMVSVEGELAGRRISMDDLIYADAPQHTVNKVVEQLVNTRLVVKGKNYIEPAHDALVRAWKLLHDWTFSVGKDKLILGTKLNVVATEFALTGKVGLLWNNNPNLPILLKEISEPQHWFNAKEIAFIGKSYRKKVNNRRWTVGITAFVIMSLAIAAIYSARQNYNARSELQRSTSLRISSAVNDLINNDNLNLPGGSERALQQTLAASRLVDPSRSVGWMQSLLAKAPDQTHAEVLSAALIAQMSLNPNVKYLDMDFTVRSIAMSPNAQYLVAGGSDGNSATVRLWDAELGTITTLFEEDEGSIYTVAFSPDSAYIAASGVGGKLSLWDTRNDSFSSVKLPFGFIASAIFSYDSKQIAVTGNEDQIQIFDIADLVAFNKSADEPPQALHILPTINIGRSIAFSKDGRVLVAGTFWGKQVWMFNSALDEWELIQSDQFPDDMSEFEGPPSYSSVAINHDGSAIVTAGKLAFNDENSSLWLWSHDTGYDEAVELTGLVNVKAVSFNSDGSMIAAGGAQGKVVVWDANSAKQISESTRIRKLDVVTISAGLESNSIISSAEDGIVHMWRETPPQQRDIETCEPIAVSPDGTLIAKGARGSVSSGQGGAINLLTNDRDNTPMSMRNMGHSKGTGIHVKEEPEADTIVCTKYNKNGDTIVTASSNNTIQFWQASANSVQALGASIPGSAFVFAQNDALIAVLERQETENQPMLIRVYETQSRNPVGLWLATGQDWNTIAQGVKAITGQADASNKLCSKLTRNMTHQQWNEWVSAEINYVAQCPNLPIPTKVQ